MTQPHKTPLMLTLVRDSAALAIAMSCYSPESAFAQDNDEILVTGTRVERQNLQAPSPVTAIDAQELTLTNTINSEQFINSLPQLVPSFDGTSNNPGTGTATANLRGLGTARTLVLVDGHRYVSAFGNGVVDLNSIPSSLVKRVDIVTGGASAVYGSDAMAGVVNFILDDTFEGLELNASYQASERGDAAIKNISATIGGNFDNGRGNATVFLGYTQRDAVFQGDRDFSSNTNVDNGTGFDPGGSAGVPGSRLFNFTHPGGNYDFTNAGFTTDGTSCSAPAGFSSEGLSGACIGNATFDSGGNIVPWVNAGPNTSRYNYAPVNYLQLPQERYTMAAFSNYDITDNLKAKIRGIFTSNNVPQELAPTPFFSSVSIDVNNPFLNAGAQAVIFDMAQRNLAAGASAATVDPDGDGVANYLQTFIGRRMKEAGPRNSNQELDSYQLSFGLEGNWGPWNEDWDWDLHAHINRVNGVQVQTGNISISAMQAAVRSNQCNIFGEGQFSNTCVQLVRRTGTIQNTTEQRNVVWTTDGPVNSIQSPAAQSSLQLVLGAEYRQENYDLRPDSVLGPDVSGFNQSLPVSGDYNSYEVFTEVYFPLIEGAAFAQEVSLNGAYRYSDYSTVGGVSSYAVGAEWAPSADIRFRGQFQHAVRAPNVVELFQPQVNGFPGAQDPCASTPGAAATASLAQCTTTAPIVNSALYNTQFQPNTQIPSLFGGNPSLLEETSDTITFGFVAQPSAIDGLTLTADYYDIKIENAIGVVPAQQVLNDCYNGLVPAFCGLITRAGGGAITNISLTNQNLATFTAKGIDMEASYAVEAEDVGLAKLGGEFALNIIGGYALERGGQSTQTSTFFDCAGYYGSRGTAACGQPNPEWKHTATVRHVKGPLLNSLRWRYIGKTEADDPLSDAPAPDPNDLFVNSLSAWSAFDWTAQWDVSDHFQISGGIINMFDKQPPILGDCCSQQANTWPGTYNPFGRQFFLSGKARF